jgi:hypothetical protein
MKKGFKAINELAARGYVKAATVGGSLLLPALSFAQTTDDAATSIASAKTVILALVAAGGAAMVAIALANVGWGAGVKFIKRLKGAA